MSKFFGSAMLSVVGEAAKSMLPNCYVCSSKAVPLACVMCGSFTCMDHGYHSVGRRESLCRKCLLELLDGATEGLDLSPYEVLGVDEGSPVSAIERAFRIKSKKCHPDLYPGNKEKEHEFKVLQWAREQAKAKAQGESHE